MHALSLAYLRAEAYAYFFMHSIHMYTCILLIRKCTLAYTHRYHEERGIILSLSLYRYHDANIHMYMYIYVCTYDMIMMCMYVYDDIYIYIMYIHTSYHIHTYA